MIIPFPNRRSWLLASLRVLLALTICAAVGIPPVAAQTVPTPLLGALRVLAAESGFPVPVTALDFGSYKVDHTSPPKSVFPRNVGTVPLLVRGVVLGGTYPTDYRLTTDTCTGVTLLPGQGCQVSATFKPGGLGERNARLLIDSAGASQPGLPDAVTLLGRSEEDPPAPKPTVAEEDDSGRSGRGSGGGSGDGDLDRFCDSVEEEYGTHPLCGESFEGCFSSPAADDCEDIRDAFIDDYGNACAEDPEQYECSPEGFLLWLLCVYYDDLACPLTGLRDEPTLVLGRGRGTTS